MSTTDATRPLSGLHLLIVDDSAACRAVMTAMAARLGAHVDVAETAAQAMAQAGAHDLAILDIGLADADGRVLTETIRQGRAARIAVLCVSGLGGDERSDSALAAGADGFAEKPFGSLAEFAGAALDALAAAGRARKGADLTALGDAPPSAVVARHALTDLGRGEHRLRASLAAGDAHGVRRAAHFLSGVAGVLKDRALVDATRRAQARSADAGGLRAVEMMLTQVAAAADRLKETDQPRP